ncbi:kynureninase [Herbihabitans rhizosphaerae]|uniref:Kynureninase n=1 Tax=Herbihabitans rhizosphaerae TaxID=1872711 RepID=A0A4Q7KW33_9PSEU|nr:aminotransferase class V-fold PLP-dependent enzyme [Herbihabitans rhizosphaerae]RZS40875.1 kynureninase [Herbihabitans rhizosphaerae]
MTGAVVSRAAELDAADPLAGFRERFVPCGDVRAYLDGNSLGRPLRASRERLLRFVDQAWGERLIRGWDEQWMDEPLRAGDALGRVALGAANGQTVIGDSTSVLLYKLIRAAVDARPGRTELVCDRDNFPTDRFVLQGIAAELGLRVRWIDCAPDGGVTPDQVAHVLGENTALVLLSHVAYRSAWLAELPEITALAHQHGALVLWDLCHSVGVVPLELDDWGVDLAVGCTYKYLNGGPGAPAFAYVRADLHERLQQPIWGWMGAGAPFAMGETYQPASGIRRFLSGTPPILGMQPLLDMIDLVTEAGLPAIREKSVTLTEYAMALADQFGVTVASPRDGARRGGHITLAHPAAREATARLWEIGVIPDFRPPDGVRIGLSPLSTSFAEVADGLSALATVLSHAG